jgi:hypothetical protein
MGLGNLVENDCCRPGVLLHQGRSKLIVTPQDVLNVISYYMQADCRNTIMLRLHAAITFVKSNLEGNTLSAQYSEEEIIPPPTLLRRLRSIGGIQTFGQKTFASLTLSVGPTSASVSTKSTIEPVHKQELSGVFHMVGKDLTVLKGQKEAIKTGPCRS